MKKFIMSLAVVAITLTLSSCGGGNKDSKKEPANTLAPEKTEIKGALKEYYTVVDKTYDIDAMEKSILGEPIIAIELQRTDVRLPEYWAGVNWEPVGTSGYSVDGNYGFGIKVKDANGKQVFSARADEGGMQGVYSSDDLKDLWELEAGETSVVRWSADGLKDASGKYTFEITSYCERVY